MAAKSKRRPAEGVINRADFLRSINIVFDAGEPERIAHYFPTEKSASLSRKLLSWDNERALLVVAPYGSGKSLVGAYALHTIENRKEGRPVLKKLNNRLESVDDDLAQWQSERIRKHSSHGLGIAMQGFAEDLNRQLLVAACDSFKRLGKEADAKTLRALLKQDSIDLLDALAALKQCVSWAKLDRVLILWDEFGRHLETLIAEGRSAELNDLQTLAEFVARQKTIPFSLSLFLHQGFLNYASNLPQSIRREWKKIEGRFLSVDYVEDSREIYRLIGEIVVAQRGDESGIEKSFFNRESKGLLEGGRFQGFKQRELADLLSRCYPISPAALELLPRISARVSQNERTLFSFLFDLEFNEKEIGADAVFDYFSEQMQADVEVGGTHRQWLETQSALSKVAGDPQSEKVLKTTCLLGLGLSGERTRATREQVALAAAGWSELDAAQEVVDELISRKLLLHRKHSDEVAVWHGADLDLRGRLIQTKADREAGFELIPFLTQEAKPPVWKPQEYNDEYSMRRFFRSEYVTVDQLTNQEAFLRSRITLPEPDEDGRILYVLANTADEVAGARKALSRLKAEDEFQPEGLERVLFVLPSEPLPLTDAALEVASLLEMEQDKELTAEDPLVLPELQQMLDDARSHLQQLIDRLTVPKPERTVTWFHQGEAFEIASPKILRRFLSNLMTRVYSATPKICSEVIVRRKPSAVVVNARKKLLLAMLERCGQEMFGIEGNFPDASMCRTLLLETGLYRRAPKSDHWGFVSPKAIQDAGLREVWERIEDFFTSPDRHGKCPSKLFKELAAPPFGVRAGLFPIFFGAGLKAFAFTTSLSRDGEYIADVMPSDIELLCREPERFSLKVFELSKKELNYLKRLRAIFSGQPHDGGEQDLVRISYEALSAWRRQLRPAALSSRRLSRGATEFRAMLKRESDPVTLLLTSIPKALGYSVASLTKKSTTALQDIKSEIEGVIQSYREAAEYGLREALRMEITDPCPVRDAANEWAACFAGLLPASHSAKAVIVRMGSRYDSDEKLIDSLAAVISRVSLPNWEDDDVAKFNADLQRTVHDVEEVCLQADLSALRREPVAKALKPLLLERTRSNFAKLTELAGPEQAERLMREILDSQRATATLK